MPAALVPTMLPHGHPAAMHAAAHVDPRAAAAMAAAAAAAAHAHGHPGYAAAVHPYAHALSFDPRALGGMQVPLTQVPLVRPGMP
eukprot:scaffold84247_cov24-Phaeocystis_antarctica.AAC.1